MTYQDTFNVPRWFTSTYGNDLYWMNHTFNQFQATIHCDIIHGIGHDDDDEDIAVAVILDSEWRKGRIEFYKTMTKEEMDMLLLSAIAEIEDLRGKLREGNIPDASAPSGGASTNTAGELAGYLKVAAAGANFASAVSGGGGGA